MAAEPARALREQKKQVTRELERLLGDVDVDEHGVEHHGLAWLYPQVKLWPTVRSVGGGSGGGGSNAPFNLEALDFLGGHYWTGQSSQDRCSTAELMDEENYQPGFEPTVLGLARSVAIALKVAGPPRPRPDADPLKPTPAITAALAWLLERAPEIAEDWFLARAVRDEATRLIARASGMMLGSRFSAGRGQCPKCYQPDTVVSDEDRAVCVNPMCRTPSGQRHCWRWADVGKGPEWVDVDEPDVRGRGQVTDEKLSRWADAG